MIQKNNLDELKFIVLSTMRGYSSKSIEAWNEIKKLYFIYKENTKENRLIIGSKQEQIFADKFENNFRLIQDPNKKHDTKLDLFEGDLYLRLNDGTEFKVDLKVGKNDGKNYTGSISRNSVENFNPTGLYLCYNIEGNKAFVLESDFIKRHYLPNYDPSTKKEKFFSIRGEEFIGNLSYYRIIDNKNSFFIYI